MGEINYDYTYYRPTEKRYGYMTGNDVIYTYGTDGEKTGRLISVVDGSGSVDYNYDALGNIIDETRTIAVPNSDNVYQFQMNYSYDSWGRMLQMTYPDGEKVNYTYQWGGDLRSMNGNNVYIDSIRYNPFGQRSAIHYGNGTHVEYTYDSLHRLVNLTSYTASGTPMQQINYTFDNVSNVTSIVNNAGTVNSLGGSYKNNYYYDKLYRLTSSGGGGEIGNYNMGMGYTPSGRIIWKKKNAKSVTLADDAYMHYSYCDDYQPHAVRHIFDEENMTHCDLRWDPAGNLGQISVSLKDNVFDHGRFLFWTVDNRMHAAVDDKHYSYYTYDYTGERRLKLTGESNRLDVNADFMTTGTLLNTPTLYPSAYLVLTSKGYTKHYYAGADRVAASLGGGGLKATGSNPGMQDRAKWLFWESHDRVNGRTLQETGQALPAWEYYGFIKDIPGRMNASVEFKLDDFHKNLEMLAEEQHDEKDVYFYHSDHLGSANWITDADGKPIQHLQYLPFGEPFVNQHLADYQERYLFTGKERDEETGYGYFGARYMDHEIMSMWLSVDPMADKYPNISPYAYCAWNPVKLIDPNGKEVYVTGEDADRVVDQLKTGNMDICRAKNGLLSTDLHGKTRDDLSPEERLIYDAINSTRVTINIVAERTQKTGDKNTFRATIDGKTGLYECPYGGSNMGSYFNPKTKKAASYDFIDMDIVEANGFDQGAAHEVSECYIAGRIAIRDCSDVKYAEQNVSNPRMMEAHNKAIPEMLRKGGIYQFGIKFGDMGKIK